VLKPWTQWQFAPGPRASGRPVGLAVANRAARIEAAHPGEYDVQDHEIELLLHRDPNTFVTVPETATSWPCPRRRSATINLDIRTF